MPVNGLRQRLFVSSPLQSPFPPFRAAFQKWSREVTVDFFAVEAANERHRAGLKYKAGPVIANPNAIVFAGGFEALEIGNLLKGSSGFDLLNDFPDPAEQCRVYDSGQIRVK